jgi:DNA-binding response OmpR family regulator
VARLLIVDDDRTLVSLLSEIVAVNGHTSLGAYGGQQALDLIASQTFDLVLLDLMMPELDGFETLKRLRSMPEGKELPVVVVTAMPDPDIDQRVARAGGNACLRKPVSFDILETAIRAHLRHG